LEKGADVEQSVHLPLRKVVAVGIGNALEFYDFLTYSFFAIQIGRSFFPDRHGLLYSLAVFGVGFLTRPLVVAALLAALQSLLAVPALVAIAETLPGQSAPAPSAWSTRCRPRCSAVPPRWWSRR
jgi:hypothetical protein